LLEAIISSSDTVDEGMDQEPMYISTPVYDT